MKNQTTENRRESGASKIVHDWNDHLKILSRPYLMENSRQYLLLRKDILGKLVVTSGAPSGLELVVPSLGNNLPAFLTTRPL